MKQYHSDGGRETVNNKMQEYCDSKGIVQTHTVAHTPQHNAIAERMNQSLVNATRSLMQHSHAHIGLWGHAVQTAAYLIARCVTSSDRGHTPFEATFGFRPDVGHLHVWGCDAHVYSHNVDRDSKLDSTSWKGVFVGYDELQRVHDETERPEQN